MMKSAERKIQQKQLRRLRYKENDEEKIKTV